MNLDRILATKRQANSLINELNNFFDDFFTFYYENRPRTKFADNREKIALKLMPLLINGVSFEDAKSIVAIELNVCNAYINKQIDGYYYNFLHKIKPHKVYACHKLHEAGIKNNEIAKLLNVAPSTVRNYLFIPSKLG